MKHTILPIYYLIFIVFIAICMISHNMFSDGMFMDGLWYAAVSKNMAHGLGSFWYPHFTNTLYSEFHEHPPLVFFLQSLCFRLFGDSFLVERFYSLCMTLTSGFFIYLFWKQINKKDSSNVTGWLPLFLWIAVPVVSWACANNMLENTTTVFTTLAVFCIWKSFQKRTLLYITISAMLLSLGFLTKSFVAFFPWSVPFLYWIIIRKIKFYKMIFYSVFLIIITAAPFVILYFFYRPAIDSLLVYFNNQVLRAINEYQTVDNRFFIIIRLFSELIPVFSIVFLVILIARLKKYTIKIFSENLKLSVFFFCLGLSCVIPFIIGMKQSGFYILPSYPFFALCFAKLIENSVTEIVNKIILKITHHIVFKGIIIMLTAGIIISFFIQIQRIGRYKEKLPDIYEIIKKIPSGQTIGICQEMRVDWSLHGYFMRYGNISLDAAPAKQNSHLFYIVDNNCKEYDFLKDYYPVGLKTKNIHLYSK